jgi:hypothetical protein
LVESQSVFFGIGLPQVSKRQIENLLADALGAVTLKMIRGVVHLPMLSLLDWARNPAGMGAVSRFPWFWLKRSEEQTKLGFVRPLFLFPRVYARLGRSPLRASSKPSKHRFGWRDFGQMMTRLGIHRWLTDLSDLPHRWHLECSERSRTGGGWGGSLLPKQSSCNSAALLGMETSPEYDFTGTGAVAEQGFELSHPVLISAC